MNDDSAEPQFNADGETVADRLERRRDAIRRDAERADRYNELLRKWKPRIRKILLLLSVVSALYIVSTFSIIHPANAPLPPGFGWQDSAWMLVYRPAKRADKLERLDLIAYGFKDSSGKQTVAAGVVVGLPGDEVSFRAVDGVAFADPDDRDAVYYRVVVNGQVIDGTSHPAFERPLLGALPRGVVRIPPGRLCVINPATADSAGADTERSGAEVDSRAWTKDRSIPETSIYGRVLLPGRLAK
jgi:hypothetical protein